MNDVLKIVDEQAEDEGLWFVARTAPEAYLQQELRRLHAAIEQTDAAIDAAIRRKSYEQGFGLLPGL